MFWILIPQMLFRTSHLGYKYSRNAINKKRSRQNGPISSVRTRNKVRSELNTHRVGRRQVRGARASGSVGMGGT